MAPLRVATITVKIELPEFRIWVPNEFEIAKNETMAPLNNTVVKRELPRHINFNILLFVGIYGHISLLRLELWE